MIPLLIMLAAGITGYVLARNFVRRRLRFVDAVYSPFAPLLAGAVAAIIAWPLALLPLLPAATAVVFGIGVGLGTATGARTLRRGNGQHQLTP
jgi:CHASE2 domain-containing sensor protein